MEVAVGILDNAINTDILVVVNTTKKTITWIPRDLYISKFNDRINAVFKMHNHKGFRTAINTLGFNVKSTLCILLSA